MQSFGASSPATAQKSYAMQINHANQRLCRSLKKTTMQIGQPRYKKAMPIMQINARQSSEAPLFVISDPHWP